MDKHDVSDMKNMGVISWLDIKDLKTKYQKRDFSLLV